MHDSAAFVVFCGKPLFSKTFRIGALSDKNICRQFLKSGIARDSNEMPHQGGADALALVVVDHLRTPISASPCLQNDIASTAAMTDWRVLHGRDQGHVASKSTFTRMKFSRSEKCRLVPKSADREFGRCYGRRPITGQSDRQV